MSRLAMLAVLSGVLAGSPASAAGVTEPSYRARCQMCHQGEAQGVPGQAPRLAGRIGTIASSPDGRVYLVMIVLNGMSGGITIDGRAIMGYMPGMPGLTDNDVARILNALIATPGRKAAAFTPNEVAAIRQRGRMSATQVAALRAKLAANRLMP
ncbi:MAG TPA: cytochrome c [Afipia sp.]